MSHNSLDIFALIWYLITKIVVRKKEPFCFVGYSYNNGLFYGENKEIGPRGGPKQLAGVSGEREGERQEVENEKSNTFTGPCIFGSF
jgi:hypothetical protein